MSAFELAASRAWLMLPDAVDNLMTIADRQGDPEALEARLGRPLENTRAVTMRNGVAVIPVSGPIMRYANIFTRISGATSTQELATDIQAAIDDPKVRSIILNIDSPGGEASGINELADLVYSARGKKPIKTYAGGMIASAAYWIGSAADEMVVDDTALVGSIGVITEVLVRAAKEGEKRYTIVSSNAPNKRPDMATEEGRSKIKETIDALGEVFVAKVARNLGVEASAVPGMGDGGGLKVGAAAVEAGLAHRLGSLEALITEMANPAATKPRKLTMSTVKTTAELRAALAAGTDPQAIEIAEPVQATVEGFDADTIKADAQKAGADAERERIKQINAMATPGFEAEVAAAIDEGLSVDAAGLKLFKAAQDRGITIAAIKADSTKTDAAAPPTGGDAKAFSPKSIWAARKGKGAQA